MVTRRHLPSYLAIALATGAAFTLAPDALAQAVDPTSGLASFAASAGFTTQGDLVLIVARLIRTAISFLGILAVVFILYGGMLYMTSAGEDGKVKTAKKVMTSALIGLVIILSSFAIAQFVISRLVLALGGGGSNVPPGLDYCDVEPCDSNGGSGTTFGMTGTNAECAEAMRNLELQMTFTKSVSATSVDAGGIVVATAAGSAVAGSFDVSGSRVTFTPSAVCAEDAAEHCFDPSEEYEVSLVPGVLTSTSGSALTCSTAYACAFSFTTGTGVDTSGPELSIDSHEAGETVYLNSIETLQAFASDDTGVSAVDFVVSGDVVYQAGLAEDSSEGTLATSNYFSTAAGSEWDTEGYVQGTVSVYAVGVDCAGHSDTSPAVSLALREAHCDSNAQDDDETGLDCGGSDCGACDAEPCDSNADCSSGYCDAASGTCVGIPKIEEVSPGDGAEGNLVTLFGENFGTTPSSVTFLGDATTTSDDVEVFAYECGTGTRWTDGEIVIQVEDGAVDGPVLVTTNDGYRDQTDDDYGPTISDFDVNGVVRPGLCALDPSTGVGNAQVDLFGLGFGDDQGTSKVYFTNDEAFSYEDWSDDMASVIVPLLNARDYRVQVWAGDYECVTPDGTRTGDLCATDADCDADAGESCSTLMCSGSLSPCEGSSDCASGESCVSRRQGSNASTFALTDASAGAEPVIGSVMTGWEACSDGGARCGEDSDCTTGSCDAADNWGPAGQYVTISGEGFGSATGTVAFLDATGTAYGSMEFPAVCSADVWNDNEITVKVPSAYASGGAVAEGEYALTVRTAGGAESEAVAFVVVSGEPGPGLCELSPSSGPVSTPVTFQGDNFGSAGAVTFSNDTAADVTYWNAVETKATVPSGAETGPAYLTTGEGYESNALNFEVADCRDVAGLCGTGEECCGDGTCSDSCEVEREPAHYAWRFSTVGIPATPRVNVFCGYNSTTASYGVSPGPWETWSDPSDVCVNAAVTATFTVPMQPTSFEGNVRVNACDGTDPDDPCANLDDGDGSNDLPVAGAIASTHAYGFEWDATDLLATSTRYRVTLLSEGIRSTDLAAMEQDYSWEFETAATADLCEVGQVAVSPATLTLRAAGIDCAAGDPGCAAYSAMPLSATDDCVPLACTAYDWNWDLTDTSKAELRGNDLGAFDACENVVRAVSETAANAYVGVVAGPDGVTNDPEDTAELSINFIDPEVTGWEPSCEAACVNVGIGAEFSAPMRASDFTAGGSVTLYACEDSLCDDDEVVEFDGGYTVGYTEPEGVYSLSIAHGDFLPSSWYRVVIDGAVESASGVALSESGSNYGEDANRYYPGDFSWTFKTKTDPEPCAVDRVEVVPADATASYIGQQTLFEAQPYGAPDDCSLSGQRLDSGDYAWDAWTATDLISSGSSTDVAGMIAGGMLQLSSTLEAGCSSECLHSGANGVSGAAVCGDGSVTYGEECDGGSDCSDSCLREGNALACSDTVTTGCCGNRVWDAGEECDDGNADNSDGCSSICLNNGASRADTYCGDGSIDQSISTGGEDCDDGDAASGDGCSSQCLFEGGDDVDGVYAICGDGDVGAGEDCDDGNHVNNDGCSSECLFEGAGACAFECVGGEDDGENCSGPGADCGEGLCAAVSVPCCGDRRRDYDLDGFAEAEDCDDGNVEDGDGCSSECLNEGASVSYANPSYCGDGNVGAGEECEAADGAALDVGNLGVAYVKSSAAQDVVDGVAGANVRASTEGEQGQALLEVSCSCTTDNSCGDQTAFGCGTGSCCFERPEEALRYPTIGQTNVCRNSTVFVDFTQEMDAASMDPSGNLTDPNLYLELVTMGGAAVTATNCPEAYVDAALAFGEEPPRGWVARAWNSVVRAVRSLFGSEADAARYACVAPVSYALTPNDVDGSRVSLGLQGLLEPDSTYRLVVLEDSNVTDATDEGVLSANAVGVDGPSDGTSDSRFTTGSEVCELEQVAVVDLGRTEALTDPILDPSVAYFTEDGEEHTAMATALTVRGGSSEPIAEIPGVYGWSWAWGSSVCGDEADPACDADVIGAADADATTSLVTAVGNTGRESIIAKATFDASNTFGAGEGSVSGDAEVVANMCDNPPTIGFPFNDPVSNFGFFYCRDSGSDETEDDDLPELEGPVDVSSHTSEIIQELIFKVQGSPDAIGVRVLKNERYLSPAAWYDAQGFSGSPSEAELDGYEAVRDGNTIYVAATNQVSTTVGSTSMRTVYPNIYVISYTEGADQPAQQIFDQVLANWTFNSDTEDVSDVNLCVKEGTYAADPPESTDFVACAWDGDCRALGDGYTCDAQKGKLIRDMDRLTDLTDLFALVDAYGQTNGICSSTSNQSCARDSDCPGTETCEEAAPTLAEGTFVRSYSTSAWPSWTSELANDLGSAVPEDPVNQFYGCDADGYEPDTCWNAASATFQCPDESHVYGYRGIGGSGYELFAQLEYDAAAWAYDLDVGDSDGSVTVEYDYGGSNGLPDGFTRSEIFCDGATYGDTSVCGDGVVGPSEECELGQTLATECDADGDGNADGTVAARCDEQCGGFESADDAMDAGAACAAFACGNGVVEEENGEDCDDGSLNGAYGHCGDDCTLDTAFYCGDGYIAGGEACDCGTVSNFSDLMDDEESWASGQCAASNGQWDANPAGTCAWNCTAPGPSCGDLEVNGDEACDGNQETWEDGLCADGSACSADGDCEDGSRCGDGAAACGASRACVDNSTGTASDVGVACDATGLKSDGSFCEAGCSEFSYELARTRTCQTSCEWDATAVPGGWTECMSVSGSCGNGTVDGGEECDDGNDANTDACTSECRHNVCGDDFVYAGVESCDNGAENGESCDAAYGGTCSACTVACNYQVRSGAFCGDGIQNGTEFCDGADIPYYCADVDGTTGATDLGNACDPAFEGVTGTAAGCDAGFTCRNVGACNGGTYNGDTCFVNAVSGATDSQTLCQSYGGSCVAPTCAENCGSSCPVTFETVSVLAQTEEVGSDPSESVDLYGYLSLEGVDNASLFVPACSVGVALTADVETDNVVPPSVDIVFLTDFTMTMGYFVDGNKRCDSGDADTYADATGLVCASDSECGSYDCSEYAPVGLRRIDYVATATNEAVSDLFNELQSAGSLVRGSAVSFYGGVAGEPDEAGYVVDQAMTDSIAMLQTAVSSYVTDPLQEWTPHYKGTVGAISQLTGSEADVKVVVLLSDGLPTHDKNGVRCATEAPCVEELAEYINGGSFPSDVRLFSAAITTSSSAKGYMAHLSSDQCGTDYDSVADCMQGEDGIEYAYQASTADGIGAMYQSIVESVIGVTVGLVTDVDGSAEVTTGTLSEGRDQQLPFPDFFECSGEDMAIPLTVSFNGTGYVTLSDMTFTYCPAL